MYIVTKNYIINIQGVEFIHIEDLYLKISYANGTYYKIEFENEKLLREGFEYIKGLLFHERSYVSLQLKEEE